MTWVTIGLMASWALAGAPIYDAYCDRDGHIANEQQLVAVQQMVRDPEALEAVFAAALNGDVRALHLFRELETQHFPAIGREVAEKTAQPQCLVPVARELLWKCTPDWSYLDFLRKDALAGARLRKAVADAFESRARELRIENQAIIASINALLSVSVAGAVASRSLRGALEIVEGGIYLESELNAAKAMAERGHQVVLRPATGTRASGATSDLLVNGVPYDVYTPTTSNPDRIISAVAKKNSQAQGVVLDLSKTTVTAEQLGNVMARVRGAGAGRIEDIVIIKSAKP